MKHILVAIDFTPDSARLIRFALVMARAFQARLRLLHVAAPEPEFVGYEPGPQSVRNGRARQLRQEHQRLQDMVIRLACEGMEADTLLVQGPTVEQLVEQATAWEADVILVGNKGHGRLRQAALGSVSSGVLRHSPCPVIVVPVGESADR